MTYQKIKKDFVLDKQHKKLLKRIQYLKGFEVIYAGSVLEQNFTRFDYHVATKKNKSIRITIMTVG